MLETESYYIDINKIDEHLNQLEKVNCLRILTLYVATNDTQIPYDAQTKINTILEKLSDKRFTMVDSIRICPATSENLEKCGKEYTVKYVPNYPPMTYVDVCPRLTCNTFVESSPKPDATLNNIVIDEVVITYDDCCEIEDNHRTIYEGIHAHLRSHYNVLRKVYIEHLIIET